MSSLEPREVRLSEVPCGFQFGAARTQRLWSHRGYVAIGINHADKHGLSIVVSPGGRSVRVFRGGRELKCKR